MTNQCKPLQSFVIFISVFLFFFSACEKEVDNQGFETGAKQWYI